MVRQSFSIDFILTGIKEETMPGREASRSHIPCLPQPQPPSKYSERPNHLKRNDQPVPSKDTKIFKNLSEESGTCLQYVVSSTTTPHKDWGSSDESTPSCSEDESEQVSSHSPKSGLQEDVDHGGTSPKSEMHRRMRTAFTFQQICKLEEMFKKQRYLGASERKKLSSSLQLSEIQVKTWFQNRRMKLKRQMQDHQHRLTTSSVCYPHPLSYYHGPPVSVNNLLFYQTQTHSFQAPEPAYATDPRFLSAPVPHQAIMNNTHPEQYSPFFNSRYM
ncbi:homeobox protein vent1B-like [Rhinoderma darwinii]|uniref:homeobox protein vent1B-like n=1 Tax=Rhinoderma darwinii TaxID=43563 RepID=UPI003F6637FF